MQERFCRCGGAIWVLYLFPNLNCRILFKSIGNNKTRYVTRCPSCGQKLNIDTLC